MIRTDYSGSYIDLAGSHSQVQTSTLNMKSNTSQNLAWCCFQIASGKLTIPIRHGVIVDVFVYAFLGELERINRNPTNSVLVNNSEWLRNTILSLQMENAVNFPDTKTGDDTVDGTHSNNRVHTNFATLYRLDSVSETTGRRLKYRSEAGPSSSQRHIQ